MDGMKKIDLNQNHIIKNKVDFFLYYIFCLSVFLSQAQIINVKGKVTDSINKPLVYANVFAVPKDKNTSIAYAITDKNGDYVLKLKSQKTYTTTISFLGYLNKQVNFNLAKDTTYNCVLKENHQDLNEVTLTYKIPITVKKDTITYNTDSFITGEERKLRDVLKKLPGIEVDRKGNILANGKKVTRLLVEDKLFFGGNTKLGVNNIPADAIEKVQVLEDYNKVAMLKGLQESDVVALNIKLKKDKKNFVFGDIETGTGIKKRYLLHPKLFYYSPKTSVNFIGDINNQGVKSFTFSDYLYFEGGVSKLASSTNSIFNSNFTNYLINQDYIKGKNNFGAFNLRKSITKNTDLSTYMISSKSKTTTKSSTINEYLSDISFIENRTKNNQTDNFFTIGKVALDYIPNQKTDYEITSFVKLSNTKSNGDIETISPLNSDNIITNSKINAITVTQAVSLNKNISRNHTLTFNGSYNFKKDRPDLQWLNNKEILENLIPLIQTNTYEILQTKKIDSHEINANIKDYWVLNGFHHLYMSIGINSSFTDFFSEDKQQLENGIINNFNTAGFGNDFNHNFLDGYVGLEYKTKINKITLKPALYYHNYFWETKQLGNKNSVSKKIVLPQFSIRLDLPRGNFFNFKYKLNSKAPRTQSLANNFILSSFNSVYRGNLNLQNSLYHTFNLLYRDFSVMQSINTNITARFTKKNKQVKYTINLDEINQFTTPIMFNKSENNFVIKGSISKKYNDIKYNFKGGFSYNDYYQILNNNSNKNITKAFTIEPSLATFFKKLPNIELGYKKDFSSYRSLGSNTKFENDKFYVFLEYDFLKDFILKMDYTFDKYQNKASSINNTFDNANTSLFYQKEDSPWGFEVTANNIFDTTFKQKSSFSSFLISDSKTFILPRIIMLKFIYKL